MRGLQGGQGGNDPNMLDATELFAKCWDSVSKDTVCRCWTKSQVLPFENSAELIAEVGKTEDTTTEISVKVMTDMLGKLSIGSNRRYFFQDQLLGVKHRILCKYSLISSL